MEEGAIKGRDISERGYICPLSMLPYSPLYVFIDFILIFFVRRLFKCKENENIGI